MRASSSATGLSTASGNRVPLRRAARLYVPSFALMMLHVGWYVSNSRWNVSYDDDAQNESSRITAMRRHPYLFITATRPSMLPLSLTATRACQPRAVRFG